MKKISTIMLFISFTFILCLSSCNLSKQSEIDRLIQQLRIDVDDPSSLKISDDAARRLVEIGSEEVVTKLTEILFRKKDLGLEIFGIIGILEHIKSTSYITQLMLDPTKDSEIRSYIADFLGTSKSLLVNGRREEDVDALIKAIEDEDIGVAAVTSLGMIGNEKDVEPLIKKLLEPNVKDIRIKAFIPSALARIGDKRAMPILIDLLKEGSDNDRKNAAQSLGILGDKEAVPALISSLSDSNERVRMNAATSLGQLGDERAVESLSKVSNDDSSELVRKSASDALNKIREAGSQSDVQ